MTVPDEPIDTTSCADDTEPDASAEARRAEERYVEDLVTRGEAVPEGDELPPGATHELVESGDDQPPTVKRRRYSIN